MLGNFLTLRIGATAPGYHRPGTRGLSILLITALLAISSESYGARPPGNHPEIISELSHIPAKSTEYMADDEDTGNADTLYVREFLLARDVVEREPVDVVESYTMSDARAWCFVRLHNSEEMQHIYFEWYYEDELYFEMNSRIGLSPNWRVYSSIGLQPGSWRVELKDRDGNTLEEIRFEVRE